MREIMTQEELSELGKRVEAIKAMAHTRPHPSVPNDPLKRLAVGPVAEHFDRLRDLTRAAAPRRSSHRPRFCPGDDSDQWTRCRIQTFG